MLNALSYHHVNKHFSQIGSNQMLEESCICPFSDSHFNILLKEHVFLMCENVHNIYTASYSEPSIKCLPQIYSVSRSSKISSLNHLLHPSWPPLLFWVSSRRDLIPDQAAFRRWHVTPWLLYMSPVLPSKPDHQFYMKKVGKGRKLKVSYWLTNVLY